MKKLIIGSFAALSLVACKKIEGEGGTGTITGKIMIDQYSYIDAVQNLEGSYAGAAEDVYIVYGDDDTIFDDKVECNYDGTFKFKYLQPGTYTIFAYSEVYHSGADINNNDDDYYTKEKVSVQVEVSKKTTTDAGTITLNK